MADLTLTGENLYMSVNEESTIKLSYSTQYTVHSTTFYISTHMIEKVIAISNLLYFEAFLTNSKVLIAYL